MKSKVIFILGPTACGKSEAAFLLAKEIGGEIVSADSMQVYKEMDIATAKPPYAWLEEVRHHLVDILSPGEEFSAGDFSRRAREAIEGTIGRGKVPIVAGGTGMYVRALLKGLLPSGSKDVVLRGQLERELEETGVDGLYHRLKELDPEMAAGIDKNNPRRLIRAIEVTTKMRRPVSEMRTQWDGKSEGIEGLYECVLIGIRRDRKDIYERVNRRVDKMFEDGLIEECRALLSKGIESNKTAMQALGYKDVISYLRDEAELAVVKENIKRRTRNFAKRQMTWFGKEDNIQWIDVKSDDAAEAILSRIKLSI